MTGKPHWLEDAKEFDVCRATRDCRMVMYVSIVIFLDMRGKVPKKLELDFNVFA